MALVDDFVDEAFDFTQFIFLRGELEWLFELGNLSVQVSDLLDIRRVLHLKVIILLNQRLDLVLQHVLIHGDQLVFQWSGCRSLLVVGGKA